MKESYSQNSIDPRSLQALLEAHDGDVALLYLYELSRGGESEDEEAARALCRTLREIQAAREKLRRLRPSAAPAAAPRRQKRLPPAEELPQVSAAELSRLGQEDEAFSAILAEAGQVIGRCLNSSEMQTMYGIYRHLGMPAELVLMLLNYCAQDYAERNGPDRRPSARQIEQEAFRWVNREILTLDQAEEYIRRQRQRSSRIGQVQSLLGLGGRDLTPTERKHIDAWLDMGFGDEALLLAYDRTVTNTGSLKWAYMNKILLSWHRSGLLEPKDILEKDGLPRQRSKRGGQAGPVKARDLDELDHILEKMR